MGNTVRFSSARQWRPDSAWARGHTESRKTWFVFSATGSALLVISTTEDINPKQMIIYVEAHSRHRLADHSAFCGSARICARDVTTPRNPRGSSFRTSWMSWIIHCAHSSCAGQSPSDPGKDTIVPIHYLILPPFTVAL